MNCPSCGEAVAANAAFCQACGYSLKANSGGDPSAKLRENANAHAHDEEEVHIWEGGYSGKAMIGTWVIAALISIGLLVAAFFLMVPTAMWSWAVAGGVIALIWLILGGNLLLTKWSVNYELTTQRFIHRKGLFSRLVDRLEVIDIDDVSFRQGFIERMVNVGSITIISSDRSHPELHLPGIADVEKVADMIDSVRRKERRRRGLHIEAI